MLKASFRVCALSCLLYPSYGVSAFSLKVAEACHSLLRRLFPRTQSATCGHGVSGLCSFRPGVCRTGGGRGRSRPAEAGGEEYYSFPS